jgi:hypothetical protein
LIGSEDYEFEANRLLSSIIEVLSLSLSLSLSLPFLICLVWYKTLKLNIYTLQGASILYMLEKFLHQETLRNGLNDYLNIHQYGNAETKDLWNVLSKHANQSLDVKVQLCNF